MHFTAPAVVVNSSADGAGVRFFFNYVIPTDEIIALRHLRVNYRTNYSGTKIIIWSNCCCCWSEEVLQLYRKLKRCCILFFSYTFCIIYLVLFRIFLHEKYHNNSYFSHLFTLRVKVLCCVVPQIIRIINLQLHFDIPIQFGLILKANFPYQSKYSDVNICNCISILIKLTLSIHRNYSSTVSLLPK